MKLNQITYIFLLVVISACAGPQYNWTQATNTATEFEIDDRECTNESREARESYVISGRDRNAGQQLSQTSSRYMVVNAEKREACLQARGWVKTEVN